MNEVMAKIYEWLREQTGGMSVAEFQTEVRVKIESVDKYGASFKVTCTRIETGSVYVDWFTSEGEAL